jgi:hypothetical protein
VIDVHVNDRQALQARSPAELAMYLRAHDWRSQVTTETHVVWIKNVDGDEFETSLPVDSALRDYSARVHDLVETLAVVEGRSELDILQEISFASMDGHYVRTFPSDSSPGMIGLEDGVLAYESLRNLLTSVAYSVSTETPKAVQPARKPAEVLKLLREARIGPGGEGSYILSVHTAVPPRLTEQGQPPLFENHLTEDAAALEPYERRVSLRLNEAVHAALSAATASLTETDSLKPFTSAIKRGVSANLCEALVGLGGEAGHPFEVTSSLALARPARTFLKPARFRRDHLTVIRAAAQELRARLPEEDVLLTGHVVRLHREASETGEVSIAGTVEDEEVFRRIWINLSDGDYDKATSAHQKMLRVSVRGDLARSGNKSYLLHAHGFEVSESEES